MTEMIESTLENRENINIGQFIFNLDPSVQHIFKRWENMCHKSMRVRLMAFALIVTKE